LDSTIDETVGWIPIEDLKPYIFWNHCFVSSYF